MSRGDWQPFRALGRGLIEQPEYKKKQQAAADKEQEAREHQDNVEIVLALDRATSQNERNQHQQATKEEKSNRREWVAVGGLYLAALVGIAAIIWSGIDASKQRKTMNDQLGVMQGQLDEMRAERRPWISIEVEPTGFYGLPTQGFMSLNIALSNVGHSPAFGVTPYVFTYIADGHDNTIEGRRRSLQTAQIAACRQVQALSKNNRSAGVVLFPNERHVPWRMGSGGRYALQYRETDIRNRSTLLNGKPIIELWAIGCVDYVFGEPPAHHQTGFAYEVAVTRELPGGLKSEGEYVTVGQSYTANQVKLIPAIDIDLGTN